MLYVLLWIIMIENAFTEMVSFVLFLSRLPYQSVADLPCPALLSVHSRMADCVSMTS